MAFLSAFVVPLILFVGVQAVPAPVPSPAITPAPLLPRQTLSAGSNVFTFGPGYTVTSTVINGQTYPIFNGNVQGGYNIVGTKHSLTGLGGVGFAEEYTTMGGLVYPVYDFSLAEADTEQYTIPGILTFHDGGIMTQAPEPTDVLCNADTNGHIGCSGLVGLVTGEILGQPFTNEGGMTPTVAIPENPSQTLVIGDTASASEVGGTQTYLGSIGGGIVRGPNATSLGAGGADLGGGQGGSFGISYVPKSSTTAAGGCISQGPLHGCVPPKATGT